MKKQIRKNLNAHEKFLIQYFCNIHNMCANITKSSHLLVIFFPFCVPVCRKVTYLKKKKNNIIY